MVKKNNGTKQQLEIINSDAPVKRVIACAGSGKTWVLTNSIASVLEEKKCRPGDILALTFTKNAAENMRSRISKRLEDLEDIGSLDIYTFNSFGNDIIYENSFELGLGKDFKLISGSQSWQILYEILKDFPISFIKIGKTPGIFLQNLLNFIQTLKNNLVSPEEFYKYISGHKEILATYKSKALRSEEENIIGISSELFDVYLKYEKIKSNRNTIDYQDQVFMPYFLLSKRRALQEKYRSKYKYIFIDEFQDTNIAQAQLMTLFYKKGYNNIMIVGDDDQGIYSFRGACIDNILNFDKWRCFSDDKTKNFYLSTNFRSGSEIIDSVQSIISSNKNRFEKEFKASDKDKESLVLFNIDHTLGQEARSLADNIKKIISYSRIKLKDMAIMSRRKRFDAIIEALKENNIKYELIGGRNFYYEPEVLFIISWLRIINNIYDETSIIYILKSAKYRIGDRDIFFLKNGKRISRDANIIDMIKRCSSNRSLSDEAKERLGLFLENLLFYIGKSRMLDLKELISLIFEDTGLSSQLKSTFGSSAKIKINNIENLIRIASDFQRSYMDMGLDSFITYLKDVAKTDYDNPDKIEISKENSIKLMSIHAAKGLEFDIVFLPMLWKNDYFGRSSGNNGFVIPAELRKDSSVWSEKKDYKSARSFKDALKKLKTEEERRVFYVACSRAKKILFLSYSQFEEKDNDKKVKEIVPFFEDFLKKESHLMPLDDSTKKFLDESYPASKNYKIFDLKQIKKMFGKGKEGKKIDPSHIRKYKWKQIEEKLGLVVDGMESELQKGGDIPGFLNSTLESKNKIAISPSVIDISKKYLKKISRSYNGGKSDNFYYQDSPVTGREDQLLFPLTPVLDYLECPLKYKWRYVYSIPQRPDDRMVKGELIHKYIENSTRLKFEGSAGIRGFSLKEYYPEDIKAYIEEFDKSNFLDFSVKRPERLMLEQLFYYKVGKYFITGKLDRVDIYADGSAEIIDYKMSAHKAGDDPSSQGNILERYRLQLMTYIGAVSDILGIRSKRIKGMLLYLGNGKIFSDSFDSADIKKTNNTLKDAIQRICNGDFDTSKNNGCKNNCEYYKLCFKNDNT